MTRLIILAAAAAVLLIAVKWAFLAALPYRRLPRHRVRYLRLRLHLRLHPGARTRDPDRAVAALGEAGRLTPQPTRPPSLSFWERALGPASAYSILIGRAHYRHKLRLPVEEHAVVQSPPRAGKTGWLASVILHYPGPVISTTTKHDMFELTSAVRARRGPVHVFNPQGVGNVPSTFRWDPLDGCQDPATAIRRADAFAESVSQRGVEDGSFWSAKASDYLRAYFHAAALGGLDLRDVARWVTGSGAAEPENILNRYPGTGRQWAAQLAELRGEANRTAQTIRMTMSRALAFLADPALAASVLPLPGESLDLELFLRQAGSLYLIAETRGEDSPVAPLFACLASELHYTACLAGSRMPGGRLDPPLLMALDEVTQICPVPVPSWLADSGGKGIQIITVAHGEAQLRSRWGADGARVIMDTSGAKIWLPGITDPQALEAASILCGTAAVREHGQNHHTRHPVLTPEMISQLPARHALVIRSGHSPVIARLPMAWNDHAYKAARHARRATPRLPPAPGRFGPPAENLPGDPWPDPAAEPAAADLAPQPGRALPLGRVSHHDHTGRHERRPGRRAHPDLRARRAHQQPRRSRGRPLRAGRRAPARPRQRSHHQPVPAGHDPGQPRRPRHPHRQARHPPGRPRRRQRGRRRHRPLPAGPATPVVETQRARTRDSAGPAPRLGRADLPARLRSACRHPAVLLGTPPGLPVHPRLAQRTVVGALPGSPARRPHPRRPGRMAHPALACCRRPDGLRGQQLRSRLGPTPLPARHLTLATSRFRVPMSTGLAAGLPIGPKGWTA